MGSGTLKVNVFLGEQVFPVKSEITVRDIKGEVVVTHFTCDNGKCPGPKLPAPSPDSNPPFYSYDVTVVPTDENLRKVTVHGVQIFDGVETYLPVHIHPALSGVETQQSAEDIFIPGYHGVDLPRPEDPLEDGGSSNDDVVPVAAVTSRLRSQDEIPIPTHITVHLGAPSASASNVRVPFKEYIKNVASSEVYPTWNREALKANVLAITSFALNRIYTNTFVLGILCAFQQYKLLRKL